MHDSGQNRGRPGRRVELFEWEELPVSQFISSHLHLIPASSNPPVSYTLTDSPSANMPAPTTPYQPYAAVHKDTKGPGDARPTSLQILKDEDAVGAYKGRVILITGTSSGIGVETARALYETGATLFLSARQIPKLEQVIDDIVVKSALKDVPRPQVLEMHLDSLDSVRKAAAEFKQRSDRLDILICNAGGLTFALSWGKCRADMR